MTESDPRGPSALFFVSVFFFGIGMFALPLFVQGLGSPVLFESQIMISGAGLCVIILALLGARSKSLRHSFLRHTRLLVTMSVLLLMISGLLEMELYARRVRGFCVWTSPLQKSAFCEIDRLVRFNRTAYLDNIAYFAGWETPVELFLSNKKRPSNLIKPNLRMALHGTRLEPASPGETIYWSSNSWGFRGKAFDVRKSPNTLRIVCMGGSTTAGTQSDRETYPVFLQKKVSALSSEPIEVINAGHYGHTVEDALELFRQKVLPLHPDILIFYEAANNIVPNQFIKIFHGSRRVEFSFGDYVWLLPRGPVFRWLYRHSALFVLLSDNMGWIESHPPPFPHAFIADRHRPCVVHYGETLGELIKEGLAHHCQVVLVSFVTLAHPGLAISYKANPQIFQDLYQKWYPFTPDEIDRIYECFNVEAKRVAKRFGVPFVDAAARFPKSIAYFDSDLIHLSPAGNALLAQIIAKGLVKNALLPPKTGTRPINNGDTSN